MHEQKKVKFFYHRSDNFTSCYANGARGGFVGKYDFKMEFYSDHVINPDEEILSSENDRKRIYDREDGEDTVLIERIIACELILSRPALEELRDFLQEVLKDECSTGGTHHDEEQ
jgi:hypothetical protein